MHRLPSLGHSRAKAEPRSSKGPKMRIVKLTVTAVTLAAALLVPTIGAIASQDATVSAGSAAVPGTGEDDDTPWG